MFGRFLIKKDRNISKREKDSCSGIIETICEKKKNEKTKATSFLGITFPSNPKKRKKAVLNRSDTYFGVSKRGEVFFFQFFRFDCFFNGYNLFNIRKNKGLLWIQVTKQLFCLLIDYFTFNSVWLCQSSCPTLNFFLVLLFVFLHLCWINSEAQGW